MFENLIRYSSMLITLLCTLLLFFCVHYIGFPGQIRKFDNQIHFNFIQIRQILSCRENYHVNFILLSFVLTFLSKESAMYLCHLI